MKNEKTNERSTFNIPGWGLIISYSLRLLKLPMQSAESAQHASEPIRK